jgi:hypothetical protein
VLRSLLSTGQPTVATLLLCLQALSEPADRHYEVFIFKTFLILKWLLNFGFSYFIYFLYNSNDRKDDNQM